MTARTTRRVFLTATITATALVVTVCGSPQGSASGGGGAPAKAGLVYSQAGPLASYPG